MKIGIDTSPLQAGHSVRGVGKYIDELVKNLQKIDTHNSYLLFDQRTNVKPVDVMHYPFFDPFFFQIPFRSTSKTVVTVHDLTPLVLAKLFPVGIRGNLRWQVNKQILKRVDAVITDSEASKNDVHKIVGISQEKIHTVYLAAGDEFRIMEDGKWKREIIQKYRLPDRFILYVGDVTRNKNLPRLVDAVKELDIPLVMVGKALANKDYDVSNLWNADLIQVHEKINGDKKFITLGYISQEDIVKIYNLATMCVLPSLYEGFGLPLLEAMQCGCPIVTTKKGSLPEVGGDAVVYVDPYDIESIAQGIHEVYTNPKLRNELIDKGMAQSKKFTWEKSANQTIQIYEQVYKSA